MDEFGKKDHLFIKDIYLINSIFFLFPIDSAHLTISYVEKALEKYSDFQSINEDESALIYLKQVLPLIKKYKLGIQMGINYIRQGICYKNLKCKTEIDYLKKGLNILLALEEMELIKIMENEISKNIRECKHEINKED